MTFTYLAAPMLASDTLVQLLVPLGVKDGDLLILGNAQAELARVIEVDDSGLLVTVQRGIEGPVRALPLLDHVCTVRTYEQGYQDGYRAAQEATDV